MKKLTQTIALLALLFTLSIPVQASGGGKSSPEIRLLTAENVIRRGSSLMMELLLPQAGPIELQVVDANGRQVWNQNLAFEAGENRVKLSVGDLQPGTYFLQLKSNQQKDAQTFAVK